MSSFRPSFSFSRPSRFSRPAALVLALAVGVGACGGDPPPAPVVPKKPVVAVEPPVDVTAVPEPPGLLVIARVAKPDAVLKTAAGWSHLPLPGSADLVRSITDDGVADAVDLSQPVDGAVALGGSKRDPKPLIAVSVAVKSFDDAKAKLSAKHKMTAGKNGQFLVEGIGAAAVQPKGAPKDDDDDDDSTTCALTHASNGARLVCGDREAIGVLAGYLSRTMTRQTWTSDVHVEIMPTALREPIGQLRAGLPFLAKSLLGQTSPSVGQLIEAAANELADIVNDTNRIAIDAQIADAGLTATLKVEYGKANSFTARLATANADKADLPPAPFMHLPGETDLALYGRGTDPKLFEHVRELLGNVALEATENAGMPDTERKAVRELVIDRMMTLFTGPLVYGKGFDAVALDKAIAARSGVKPGDLAARDEADRLIAEQMIGWHLVEVTDPITKVGPMLKDWAALWNRPAFAKWAKSQTTGKLLAQMRTAALPSGVTLPKDAVHLEIVLPRADLEEMPSIPPAPPGSKPAPLPKAKKIPVKALVLHVIAVPDQGGTWIGFGMDGKLVAQRAASALSTAPDATTLGKTASGAALSDVKASGAILATLRGVLVLTALDRRSQYGMLGSLSGKGQTPITLTSVAQGPGENAPAGSVTGTLKIPRGAIEDLVKVGLTSAR